MKLLTSFKSGMKWLEAEPSETPEIGDKVFVYGTLKLGLSNHSLMKGGFIANGKTVNRWVLPYTENIPFLLPTKGKGLQIKGEVYCPTELGWFYLDKLEGHPNLYKRGRIKIKLDSGEVALTWCYFCMNWYYPFHSEDAFNGCTTEEMMDEYHQDPAKFIYQ